MSLYASCPCGIPEGSSEPHLRTDCPLYGMTGDSDIVSTSDRLARRMGGRFRVSASAPEQADQADVLREALKEAYRKGATDVHNYWVKNPGEPPRGDPEFGEAASDYAEVALDILDISTRTAKAQEG